MAVKIRLARHGAKKRPYYRIVVADSRSPRDGRFIEEVGRYNPCTHPHLIQFDMEKVDRWIADGAQQDGVGLLDAVLFLFRKNRAVTQIALGTQIELLIFEFGDAFGRLLQSLLSPRSHFLANAIARNDGDGVLLCRITHSTRL